MIYLKATDEATFTAALKTAGWAYESNMAYIGQGICSIIG